MIARTGIWAAAVFGAALATAPFQCAKEPPPGRLIEEDPSEVLYQLAERFREQGDTKGRVATLRFLVERYPTSRFAKTGAAELEEMGIPPSASGAPAAQSAGAKPPEPAASAGTPAPK